MSTATQNGSTQFDIAIVGGGMVGGAVAAGLLKEGYRIALIEPHPMPPWQPSSKPDLRVSALNLGSEQLLQSLGAWRSVLSMRAQPYTQLSVWEKLAPMAARVVPPGLRKTVFTAELLQLSHLGHIIENRVIQLALQQVWQASANLTLFRSTLQQLQSGQEVASLQLADGAELQAKLVIGADGAQSAVRRLAGIPQSLSGYDQHAMVFTVAYQGTPAPHTWQQFTPHGPVAFLPLPTIDHHNWASLVWYDDPARCQEVLSLADDELKDAIQREFPAELPPLLSVADKGRFPLAKSHAKRYFSDRVVLVGDAAHTINPLAGQGVNLGLQDVSALLETLRSLAPTDPGDPVFLNKYQQERRQANTLMMTVMDAFYYHFSNDIAPLKFIRNVGLGLANQLTPAKKQVLAYALGADKKTLAKMAS